MVRTGYAKQAFAGDYDIDMAELAMAKAAYYPAHECGRGRELNMQFGHISRLWWSADHEASMIVFRWNAGKNGKHGIANPQ